MREERWVMRRSYVNLDTGSLPDVTKELGALGQIYGFVLARDARASASLRNGPRIASDGATRERMEFIKSVGRMVRSRLAVIRLRRDRRVLRTGVCRDP